MVVHTHTDLRPPLLLCCRQAGISIGPSIYKKGFPEQTAYLQEMLEKQGLHEGSKPREIAKVKKR